MKPYIKTIVVSVVSAVVGGLIVITALKMKPELFAKIEDEKAQTQNHQSVFDDILKKQDGIRHQFDSWFSDKFGGGAINDISKREDADFVYYDIKVDDLNSTSVNTKIENGYITITGSIEKKTSNDSEDSSSASVFKSTFNRTFPLPDHVDHNKMEMLPEKDKIVLKFPKIKS